MKLSPLFSCSLGIYSSIHSIILSAITQLNVHSNYFYKWYNRYNNRSPYRLNFRGYYLRGSYRSNYSKNQDNQLEKESLVEEILGQGQDCQREMMVDVINVNSLDIMQKNVLKKKGRLNTHLLIKPLNNIERKIQPSIQSK